SGLLSARRCPRHTSPSPPFGTFCAAPTAGMKAGKRIRRKRMVRLPLAAALLLALPGVAAAQGSASDPDRATAGALLLWLGRFVSLGLLLFWALPLAVAA